MNNFFLLFIKKIYGEKKLLKGHPSWTVLNNAVVLPHSNPDKCLGGVVSEKGQLLDCSNLYEERTVGIYDFNESDVIYENKTVL